MIKEVFGQIDGKDVYKYTLTGDHISLSILDFGATIQSLYVDGLNVVQSFETVEDYKLRGGYVCGAIGRVANRIAKAKFTLNGQEYPLTKNTEKIADRGGVALEPQFPPNAINMEGFEKPILQANTKKKQYICLQF